MLIFTLVISSYINFLYYKEYRIANSKIGFDKSTDLIVKLTILLVGIAKWTQLTLYIAESNIIIKHVSGKSWNNLSPFKRRLDNCSQKLAIPWRPLPVDLTQQS